jgi:hypothetical protein
LLYRSVPYGCYCLLSNRMQQKAIRLRLT